MKRCRDWIVRQWRQNVLGVSPSCEYKSWPELAKKLAWQGLDETKKEAKKDRLQIEFDDETTLMDISFRKLIGVLTPLGLIFLFGGQSGGGSLFTVSACISMSFVVWALSARFKVFATPADSSSAALIVDDGAGKVIDDETAATVWWLYRWKWHRYHTRLAIDRLFLCACALIVGTLSIIAFSA